MGKHSPETFMLKFFGNTARRSLNRFIGCSLVLTAAYAVAPIQAQLPAVVAYGQRQPLPLPSGTANLTKVARDAQGDIFIMSSSVPRIDEIPVSGPAVTVVPSTDPSLVAGPYNVNFTVDPAGNIYAYGKYSGAITKIPRASNGTYTLSAETVETNSFSVLNNNNSYGITDLAVDSLGNLYAGTSSGHALGTWTGTGLMMSGPSAPGGRYLAQYAAYNSSTSPTYPAQVAVDASGNVYYADTAHAYEIPVASALSGSPVSSQIGYNGTGTCPGCTTLPSTIVGLFLDTPGNVYLISSAAASFYVIPNNGSQFTTTSNTYTLPGSVSGHASYSYGTVDNQGNLIAVFGGSLERYGSSFYGAFAAGAVAVGTANNGYTVFFLFTQSTTLKATGAVTLTGSGAAYGGNSLLTSSNGVTLGTVGCTAGTTYTAGQSCSVGVNSKSQVPGAFNATVSLLGTTGNTLATYAMTSTATGAAVTVDGSPKLIGTGYSSPAGVAVDNTGAMYVADPDSSAVYKYAAGSTAAGTTIGTGLSSPSGVAIDASGDIFIADTGNDRVVSISGGTQTVVATPGYSLSSPRGVSIDVFGNLYIADTGNSRVLELPNPYAGEPGLPTVVGFTGLVAPYSVAFGPFNDVYVADAGSNAVYMLGAFATTASTFPYASPAAQVTVGSGFSAPSGVAVDASGTVYVADTGNARIVKVPSVSSSIAYTAQSVMVSGLNKPFGIATDTTNDLYYTDMNAPAVYFELRSAATTGTAATIPFGTVATSTTGNQTATLANAGLSTSLTIASVTEPTTPFGGSSSCGATLTPGSTCTVSLTYSPTTAGTATPGTLTFTDNALGVTSATQKVTLTGAASGAVASVTVTGASSVVYGQGAVFTVTAKDSSGITAVAGNGTYTVGITGTATSSTSVTLSGGTGTFNLPSLGAGAYTLSVTIAGFQGTASITVTKAPLYITPANVSRPFDTASPALSLPTYSGYGNADTAATVIATNATSTASVTRVTPYGSYPITASGLVLTTAGAANYTAVYVAGIYSVTGSAPQSILFPSLPAFPSGATTYTLTGQATSGLPLTYAVTSGSATISGNVLTVTAPGAVTVTAYQLGNSTYAAATAVSRSFTAQ
jgi:sugar lactone lactonase YvrE